MLDGRRRAAWRVNMACETQRACSTHRMRPTIPGRKRTEKRAVPTCQGTIGRHHEWRASTSEAIESAAAAIMTPASSVKAEAPAAAVAPAREAAPADASVCAAPTTAVTALTPMEPPSCCSVLNTELPLARCAAGSYAKPLVIAALNASPAPCRTVHSAPSEARA